MSDLTVLMTCPKCMTLPCVCPIWTAEPITTESTDTQLLAELEKQLGEAHKNGFNEGVAWQSQDSADEADNRVAKAVQQEQERCVRKAIPFMSVGEWKEYARRIQGGE